MPLSNKTLEGYTCQIIEEKCVTTYPSAEGRHEAHGCISQGRKTCGVATKVYLRKMLEKPKSGPTNFKNKIFGSCFYTQGRY